MSLALLLLPCTFALLCKAYFVGKGPCEAPLWGKKRTSPSAPTAALRGKKRTSPLSLLLPCVAKQRAQKGKEVPPAYTAPCFFFPNGGQGKGPISPLEVVMGLSTMLVLSPSGTFALPCLLRLPFSPKGMGRFSPNGRFFPQRGASQGCKAKQRFRRDAKQK